MFEPFERCLDAPALAVEAAERLSKQGRSAGINNDISAATTYRPSSGSLRLRVKAWGEISMPGNLGEIIRGMRLG